MLIEIKITKGRVTYVDEVDSDLASYPWFMSPSGYARGRVDSRWDGRTYALQRVILKRMIGRDLLPDEYADHINGDKLNNSRSNLRIATHSQNMMNKGAQANNKSGYKGVAWHKAARKWEAYITVDGKRVYLGLYDDPIKAARAYDAKARLHHGEFAYTNFSEGDA